MTDRNTPLLVIILVLVLAAILGGAWLWWNGNAAPAPAATTNNDNRTTNAPNITINSTTTTQTDTASSGISGAALAAIRAKIASMLGVSASSVTILSVSQKTWSDGCLGLGTAAESCIAMITPGYQVTVQANGKTNIYRTNLDGSVVRKQE